MSLPYFPFEHDEYDMPMNARPQNGPVIEVDVEHYLLELALKDEILATDHRYYFQSPPQSEALAWDCIEVVLPDLVAHNPKHFALEKNGDEWTFSNQLKETRETFTLGDASTLPLAPLDWLGRHVQEDLILMNGDEAITMAAGHLCFAASWCLDDKIGEGFLRIHEPTPGFIERIGHPALSMMQRLKPHRPTGRLNWTISANAILNLAPRTFHEWAHTKREITHENAGERLHLRVERQMFVRLPKTNGILFSIHTYLTPLAEVVADPIRLKRFANNIKGVPRPTREYKGWAQFYDAMVDFVEIRIRDVEKRPRSTVPGLRAVPTVNHKKEPVMGNIAYSSINTSLWEPMPIEAHDLIEGDPVPKVHWLKKNEKNEATYLTGLWLVQPATFRWLFFGNETFHVLEGCATITTDDGTSVCVKSGDIISFPMNTPSVWEVHETLKKMFVITM